MYALSRGGSNSCTIRPILICMLLALFLFSFFFFFSKVLAERRKAGCRLSRLHEADMEQSDTD